MKKPFLVIFCSLFMVPLMAHAQDDAAYYPGASAPDVSSAPVVSNDSSILDRLEDLNSQITRLRSLIETQNDVIQSQAVQIENLKTDQLKLESASKVEVPVYVPDPKAPSPAPSWTDGMKQSGDLRLRYEALDNHGGTDQDSRNRFRMRLRYGIEKQLGTDFTVGFRITTGAATENNNSNQTMTGNFNLKGAFFDKLYVKYIPSSLKNYGIIEKVELGGGKFDNPFLRGSGLSTMVWYSDVFPEGIYEAIDFKSVSIGESKFAPFIIAGQFPLVESGATGTPDAEVYGFMGGMNSELSVGLTKPLGWLSSVAYYAYPDYGVNGNFATGGNNYARGNTLDANSATTLAAKEFHVITMHQEFKLPTPWKPTSIFGDYAHNMGNTQGQFNPDKMDDAWMAGIKIGSAKKKGEWDALYGYYYVEPNAIVGAFSDADVTGPGGAGYADRRGSMIKLGYKLTDYLTAGFRVYISDTVSRRPNEDATKYQTDLVWNF